MEITKYDNKYKSQTIDLILTIQKCEFNIEVTPEQRPDLLNIEQFYSNFWLALYNDNVIGTISILPMKKSKLALQNMYVHKDFRGIKYETADKLLKEILNFANQNKFKEIYLGTAIDFFAAHKFYERKGFAQIGEETLPKEFPLMNIDSKFYKLIL